MLIKQNETLNVFRNSFKSFFIQQKRTELTNFMCLFKNDSTNILFSLAQRVAIWIELHQDYNFRLQTNEQIRGHHITLSLWKINFQHGRGGGTVENIHLDVFESAKKMYSSSIKNYIRLSTYYLVY